MVDILLALEKLRKLRKEAAARKGNRGFTYQLAFLPLFPCSFPFLTIVLALPPNFEGKCVILHYCPPVG